MIYLLTLSSGELVQRFDDDAQPGETIVATIVLPRLMTPYERWSGSAIVDDLDALRAARWAMIREARDKAQTGGCTTPFGVVETTERARGLLSGAVQGAVIAQSLGQPYTLGWTLMDNTTVALDASQTIQMGVAVLSHISNCHALSVQRRAALDAATSKIEIEAVPVSVGWPS